MRLREVPGQGDCLVAMSGADAAYAATMLDRDNKKITAWLRHRRDVRRVPVEEARRLLGNYRQEGEVKE